MTHLTREQIAEKVRRILLEIPVHNSPRDIPYADTNEAEKKLTSLIRDLQKQTWDRACIEQREKCAHRLHKDQPKNLEEAIDIAMFCPVKPFPSNL